MNLTGHNPFLCDALWASNDVIYTDTIIDARRTLQSNRLSVFYRGVNYSGVMTSDNTLC